MALTVKKRVPVPTSRRAHHTLPQRTYKKQQRQKTLSRMLTSFLVLAVLSIGAGIAYTWWTGQQRTALADQPAPVRKSRAVFRPPKIASDAPIGVATQTYTSDLKRGDNASITVRTNPAATCSISVKYNNVPATDSGLVEKLADEFGVASWAWTVAANAPTGKWPISVTCKNKKNSAVVIVDAVVK